MELATGRESCLRRRPSMFIFFWGERFFIFFGNAVLSKIASGKLKHQRQSSSRS
jgi:hypothetical protein